MAKFIVTGAEGFIGKAVLETLKLKGDHVWQIHQDKQTWEDELALESMVEQCDGIFHIGAISDTTEQDPNYMLYWNYTTSKRLFDLARKYKKKVVYSSSAACYGNDGLPNNIYGWSKLLAEEYGLQACKKFVALRYFNVYGPGENEKGKMASVAYQAKKAGKFKLFPKNPKRDFVYIADVVHANLHAMSLERGVFDVGFGKAETFESLVEGMEISYTYHAEDKIPSWYQFYTKADKLKFMPGWRPEWDVESGTRDYRENFIV